MILVSGVSRSGTSLMMNCFHEALGDDRIHGVKFPQKSQVDHLDKPYLKEPEHLFKLRQRYMRESADDIRKDFKKTMDMNPNGFWESSYAVQGIYYRLGDVADLDKWLTEEKPTVCKIVSRGLWKTDPRYVNKVIYMTRHPRDIAKSQERLKRNLPVFQNSDGGEIRMEDELVINTPKMYIDVTRMVCEWLIHFKKDVDFKQFKYDDLIDDPEKILKTVGSFVGEPSLSESAHIIDKKLRRSDKEGRDHKLSGLADDMYNLFEKERYEDVIKLYEEHSKDLIKSEGSLWCFRLKRSVRVTECEACVSGGALEQFRKTADQDGVNWRDEPCAYECSGLKDDPVSIEDSIENNFWRWEEWLT